MQFDQGRRYVIEFASAGDKTGESVLDQLKFCDVCFGGIVEQRVAVVQFCTDNTACDGLECVWW